MTMASPRIGVGAVIFNERQEVLLIHRKKIWMTEPGAFLWGKWDLYEQLEACVVREIEEEVG